MKFDESAFKLMHLFIHLLLCVSAGGHMWRSEDNRMSSLRLTHVWGRVSLLLFGCVHQNCHPVNIQRLSHPLFPSGYRSAGIADHTTAPDFMILGLTLRSSCSQGKNFTHWAIFPAHHKQLLVFETGFYGYPRCVLNTLWSRQWPWTPPVKKWDCRCAPLHPAKILDFFFRLIYAGRLLLMMLLCDLLWDKTLFHHRMAWNYVAMMVRLTDSRITWEKSLWRLLCSLINM